MKDLIERSPKIVVLTGAGVSTDSNIQDFKTMDENWTYDVSREQAISIRYFLERPQSFWDIYRYLFESKTAHEPNDYHRFLAGLEADHDITVITQNVDGLHTKAGSTDVIEFHGSINNVVCLRGKCQQKFPYSHVAEQKLPLCPGCGDVLKPDVCLFGEKINGYNRAHSQTVAADLVIVAGTSLQVAPFNELPVVSQVYARFAKRLWINNDAPPSQYDFTDRFLGSFKEYLGGYHS